MKPEYDARRERRVHRLAVDEYEVQALIWEPCPACNAEPPRSVEFARRGRAAKMMAVVVCSACGRES